MTSKEFLHEYWNQYISIEKEFATTLQYLALDINNEKSYSPAYSKLMLEIGSELDVVFKEYCQQIDPSFKKSYSTIVRYKNSITNCNPDFVTQEVVLFNYDRSLQPWLEWNTHRDSPWWWVAYNKIKHERTSIMTIDGIKQEGFKFANQKYTLLALAGLYQIMVYYYRGIALAEGKEIVTPIPGSRLFKLNGGIWNGVQFYGDNAFYIDNNGHFIWETSTVYY